MSETQGGEHISATITGDVRGQIAVGSRISQMQAVGARAAPTAEELAELRRVFEAGRARIAAEAPQETRGSALERVAELEEALIADRPDLGTVEYVKRWFLKRLPGLVGVVTGLLVHPVVGKIVHAAGEAVVAEIEG